MDKILDINEIEECMKNIWNSKIEKEREREGGIEKKGFNL